MEDPRAAYVERLADAWREPESPTQEYENFNPQDVRPITILDGWLIEEDPRELYVRALKGGVQ